MQKTQFFLDRSGKLSCEVQDERDNCRAKIYGFIDKFNPGIDFSANELVNVQINKYHEYRNARGKIAKICFVTVVSVVDTKVFDTQPLFLDCIEHRNASAYLYHTQYIVTANADTLHEKFISLPPVNEWKETKDDDFNDGIEIVVDFFGKKIRVFHPYSDLVSKIQRYSKFTLL